MTVTKVMAVAFAGGRACVVSVGDGRRDGAPGGSGGRPTLLESSLLPVPEAERGVRIRPQFAGSSCQVPGTTVVLVVAAVICRLANAFGS
jgi:hypothetical protein